MTQAGFPDPISIEVDRTKEIPILDIKVGHAQLGTYEAVIWPLRGYPRVSAVVDQDSLFAGARLRWGGRSMDLTRIVGLVRGVATAPATGASAPSSSP